MELISQHSKQIMEGCKARAREAGLRFQEESLEYIVTNRDLLELSPKLMIPTLYDYWVQDVEVLKEKGKYELYPGNPYETVINTRPPISFYNDNNPDWLNVMIFYHVLAHIDFFQNNLFFGHTWEYDFTGQALSDKRVIAKLRSEKGRWVDYVIEFARGIDNLVAYHGELARLHRKPPERHSGMLDYYFDVFLQDVKKRKVAEYVQELERYNACVRAWGDAGEQAFFREVNRRYPEFEALYGRRLETEPDRSADLLEFLVEQAPFLRKEENRWMRTVLEVVRKTSLFFQPQIRTKILNEGWASYWHEKLFLGDDRIRGHEVDFARVNAWVTSMPRVGLNPYALGMRLFFHIEASADKGRDTLAFLRERDAHRRDRYDARAGGGREVIFRVRENLDDFMFVSRFVDQEFVNAHKLFVSGKRLDRSRMVWEYYVKSRKAADYRQMILDGLYHPPHVEIRQERSVNGDLYLDHLFEGKPLVKDYIANTLMGIEFLWGGRVRLETSELIPARPARGPAVFVAPWALPEREGEQAERRWQRVLYTMENRKLSRKVL